MAYYNLVKHLQDADSLALKSGFFCKFLRNSSNSADMNVDGSVTPAKFSLTFDKPFAIYSILITVEGVSSTIANGVRLVKEDENNNELYDFLDGRPINRRLEWSEHSFRVTQLTTNAGFIVAELDCVPVSFNPGEKITFIVRDDLSVLSTHTCKVVGVYLE